VSGYKRDIVIRVVPTNGAETVHWFTDRLTDLGMHVNCTPTYPRTMQMREDINRVLRPVVFCKRVRVIIEVFIASMADQWFLQEIEEALDDPTNYSVFLSLDGGVVEREIVWDGAEGLNPQPLRGKTCVGATFVLSVQTKAPIGTRGPMMTDPVVGSELLQNGSFEQWGGAGDVQGFTEVVAGGTATQETSLVHTAGGSALKLDRTGAGALWVQQDDISLKREAWYRISGWFRSSSTGRGRIQLSNQRLGIALVNDGKTWQGTTQYALDLAVTTAYAYSELYFRADPSFLASDDYRWFSLAYDNPSTLYHDDCSLYGPVLRPGVATW
jgi:hypothetical protein